MSQSDPKPGLWRALRTVGFVAVLVAASVLVVWTLWYLATSHRSVYNAAFLAILFILAIVFVGRRLGGRRRVRRRFPPEGR